MSEAKFRIYEGVVCLEMPSRTGHKWWDQGYSLGYTPLPINRVERVQFGVLHSSRRAVLAALMPAAGGSQWVAINLPRSDITGLKKRGFWHAELEPPYTELAAYTPWPEKL